MLPKAHMTAEHQRNEQETKRRRLDHDMPAYAALETHCAQPDVSLDVDIMQLDYLAYQATCAALARRGAQVQTSALLASNLTMVDSFLAIFKARHDEYDMDEELRFRLLLLKVVILYTQRLTRNPSTRDRTALGALRQKNKGRAERWLDARHEPCLDLAHCANLPSQADVEAHRAYVLHSLGIPAEDEAYEEAFYGTQDAVSLLDILPLFMQVSAARDLMNGAVPSMTDIFMRLAAEFMLQACLEQILVFGAQVSTAVREAFAWGHTTADANGDDQWQAVNDMFCDPVYEREVEGWASIKSEYRRLVAHHEQDPDLVQRLDSVADDHPLANFDSNVLGFLAAMMQSIPKPILVQLESGQLDGMTKTETQEFIEACGLSVAHFWKEPAGFKGVVA